MTKRHMDIVLRCLMLACLAGAWLPLSASAQQREDVSRTQFLLNHLYHESSDYRSDAAHELLSFPESQHAAIHNYFRNRLQYEGHIRIRVQKLIDNLDHADWSVRQSAASELLERYGEISLPYLEASKNPSRPNQWKTINELTKSLQQTEKMFYIDAQLDMILFLTQLQTADTYPMVKSVLDYKHPDLQILAAECLEQYGQHDIITTLSPLLHSKDSQVQDAAIEFLLPWMDTDHFDVYRNLAKQIFEESSANKKRIDLILQALGKFDDKENTLTIIKDLLSYSSATAIRAAFDLIATMDSDTATLILKPLLKKHHPLITLPALQTVRDMKLTTQLPELQKRFQKLLTSPIQSRQQLYIADYIQTLIALQSKTIKNNLKSKTTGILYFKSRHPEPYILTCATLDIDYDILHALKTIKEYSTETQRAILETKIDSTGIDDIRVLLPSATQDPGLRFSILATILRHAKSLEQIPFEVFQTIEDANHYNTLVSIAVTTSTIPDKDELLMRMISDCHSDANFNILRWMKRLQPDREQETLISILQQGPGAWTYRHLTPYLQASIAPALGTALISILWDLQNPHSIRSLTTTLTPLHSEELVAMIQQRLPHGNFEQRQSLYLSAASLGDSTLLPVIHENAKHETLPALQACATLAQWKCGDPNIQETAKVWIAGENFITAMVGYAILLQEKSDLADPLFDIGMDINSGRNPYTIIENSPLYTTGELLFDWQVPSNDVPLRLLSNAPPASLTKRSNAELQSIDVRSPLALSKLSHLLPICRKTCFQQWRGPVRLASLALGYHFEANEERNMLRTTALNLDNMHNTPDSRVQALDMGLRSRNVFSRADLTQCLKDPHDRIRAGSWNACVTSTVTKLLPQALQAKQDASRHVRVCATLYRFHRLNPEWGRD